ncbi:uncharacterized protein LOC123556770 [Mercenaria mercenaria]|uniref:uncharacterized protein LOC123556770 n=1 Tax=Mercenaria mercenaria TaxID=6596 RepID=UPI00234E6EB5|nr:uncharacterized protein LOC123556770 [Mercenaria mercenaria]
MTMSTFKTVLSRYIKGHLFLSQRSYGAVPALQKLTEEDTLKLTYAINSLKYHEESSLIFLKIKGSNAEDVASFSNATCRLQTSIEPEVELKIRRKRFGFASIFHPGIKILENFLQNWSNVPKDSSRLEALKRLIDFVPKIPNVSQRLRLAEENKQELVWSLQLLHHYLKELSVNQSYLIDHNSKLKETQCSHSEGITADYGDTSLGSESVWHGNVDAMLGIQNIPVNFLHNYDEDKIEGKQFSFSNEQSSFDISADQSTLHHREQQLVSQAIVFAFLQRKLHSTDFKHFLIPSIGMSREQAVIYFYDPDHDILMKNLHPFELFGDEDGGLYYATVIALWLCMNYPILGSGIGKSIKNTGFTADFLKTMSQPVQDKYKYELQFGGVRNKSKDTEPPKYVYDVLFDEPLVPSLGQI